MKESEQLEKIVEKFTRMLMDGRYESLNGGIVYLQTNGRGISGVFGDARSLKVDVMKDNLNDILKEAERAKQKALED